MNIAIKQISGNEVPLSINYRDSPNETVCELELPSLRWVNAVVTVAPGRRYGVNTVATVTTALTQTPKQTQL